MQGTPQRIFHDLCPVREHDYLENWKARIIYSQSELVEEGCIFATRRECDAHETIWVCTVHDVAAYTVKFVMTTSGSRVGRLTVNCVADPDSPEDRSQVTFNYEFTSLPEAGDSYLDQYFTEAKFEEQMNNLERAWNHYLTTGQMLRQSS